MNSWHGQWRYMDHVPINHTITPNSFSKMTRNLLRWGDHVPPQRGPGKNRASTGRTIIGMEKMSLWDTKKSLPEHHRKSQWHPMTHFSPSFIVDCYYRRSTVWLVNWVILLSGNEQFSLALLTYVHISIIMIFICSYQKYHRFQVRLSCNSCQHSNQLCGSTLSVCINPPPKKT